MRYILTLGVFVSAMLFGGCSAYKLEVSNVDLYNEGVQVLDSAKSASKVRIEVGQKKVKGSSDIPLALFISALNLSAKNVVFDKSNVKLYQKGRYIEPLDEEAIKSDKYDFDYIIEAYNLYMPSRPIPSYPMIGSPFIYRGYMGGFYMYDYIMISARDRMQAQMRLEERRARQAIIFASLMRKNTLEPKGAPRGGFVLYAPKYLKKGLLELHVRVGDEEHIFDLNITK